MAPEAPGAGGWLSPGTVSLEPSLYCIAVLLIIPITLLSLCTKCGKHTFKHQNNSEKVRTPSQLIRVSPIEGATEDKESLWHTNITADHKGDPALTPVPGNNSLPEGKLWYTPWRSHNGVPVFGKGELSANSNERMTLKTGGIVSEDETGSTASERKLTPETHACTVLHKTPHLGEGTVLQAAPLSRTQALGCCYLPPTPIDVMTGTKNLTSSLQWPLERRQHTFETVQEMCSRDFHPSVPAGACPEDNTEDRGYQTIEELNGHSSQKNHMADGRCGEDPAVISLTPLEGKAEDINATYARISKKIKTSKAPVQLPLEEKEESAPPVPDKRFDMEECT